MERNLSTKHGGEVSKIKRGKISKRLTRYCRIYRTRPQRIQDRLVCTGYIPGKGAEEGSQAWDVCPDYERCLQNAPKTKWEPPKIWVKK